MNVRISSLLVGLLLGFCPGAKAGRLVGDSPSMWKVVVEVGSVYRITCYSPGVLRTESKFLHPREKSYSDILFDDAISPQDAKDIYDSAVKTLEEFSFSDGRGLSVMDGAEVTVELTIGERSLTATFYPKESAPASIQHILEYCQKREFIPWNWSKELPKEVGIPDGAKNRTVAKARELFKESAGPFSVKQVVDLLGRPDGFSRHFGVSLEQCVQHASERGGTFRFVLEGGSELLVRSPDFSEIDYATLVGPKKDDGETLYILSK